MVFECSWIVSQDGGWGAASEKEAGLLVGRHEHDEQGLAPRAIDKKRLSQKLSLSVELDPHPHVRLRAGEASFLSDDDLEGEAGILLELTDQLPALADIPAHIPEALFTCCPVSPRLLDG